MADIWMGTDLGISCLEVEFVLRVGGGGSNNMDIFMYVEKSIK